MLNDDKRTTSNPFEGAGDKPLQYKSIPQGKLRCQNAVRCAEEKPDKG